MSDKQAVLRQIYDFVQSSNSFAESAQGLQLLVDKYIKLPGEVVDTAQATLRDTLQAVTMTERLKEVRDESKHDLIKYAVDWASITGDNLRFLDNNCFNRISQAFRILCVDDIARGEAKKILVIRVAQSAKEEVSFQATSGTLLIAGTFAVGDKCPSAGEIQSFLEKELRISYMRQHKKLFSEQLPTREKEILESLGVKVPLEVAEETFQTATSLEFLDNVGGLRLLMALRTLAGDQTAKEIVGEHLKRVRFVNVDTESKYNINFDVPTGLLTLCCQYDRPNAEWGSNILSYAQIYEAFMSKLDIKSSQKRKELRERLIPDREKEVADEMGSKPVKYVVCYDTFPGADELNYIDNVVCHRVSMALRCISGADKERVKTKLNSIEIKNTASKDDKKLSFANGVLTLTVALQFGLDGAFSDNEIRAFLNNETK